MTKCIGLTISTIRNLKFINSFHNSFKVPVARTFSIMESAAPELVNDDSIVRNKKRTRYNGRIRKRLWEDGVPNKKVKEGDEPFVRVKKRKTAMLLGYSGVNHFGMQRNPSVHTIEEDLMMALLKAEYVDQEGFDCMQQIDFQRAARTDRGVSAVRQVVSLKLPLEAVPEKINEYLPECIRVFGIKRVTKGFNSKIQCDARTYSYTLPSFSFESTVITTQQQKEYRIPKEKIEELNNFLNIYRGTKNYHNFTSKKSFTDPSSLRYMMSFGVDKVFVQSDMEFVLLKVKGQSFMLHQIRKMVGAALAVLRGVVPRSTIEKAFEDERIRLPIAPGLGLLLEQVHYDKYDARYGKDGVHPTLHWEELNDVIEKFKMEHIIPNTVKTEISQNSMAQWLELLSEHSFTIGQNNQEDEKDDNNDEEDVDNDSEKYEQSEETLHKKNEKNSDKEENNDGGEKLLTQ